MMASSSTYEVVDGSNMSAMETDDQYEAIEPQASFETPRQREIAVCASFFLLSLLVDQVLPTHERDIPVQQLNDGSYIRAFVHNEEFNGDTVSNSMLIILGLVLPLGIQLALSHRFGRDVSRVLCVYSVAFGTVSLVTNLVKNYVGYLRPSFFDLCDPDDAYESCAASGSDYRKSFPSGHASLTFCGMMCLSRFLTTFGNKRDFPGRVILIAAKIPLLLAFFVAASRVVDNKHFPADVVAGSVIGASVGGFVSGIYY